MIEEMKKAIEIEQRKRAALAAHQKNPKSTPRDYGFDYVALDESRIDEIDSLYQSYKGRDEFLYRPSRKEIEDNMASGRVCYLGMQTASGTLVGVIKAARLNVPDAFFMPPQYDQGEKHTFYGMSGLIVSSDYRKKGLAKYLTQTTLGALQVMGATGVYADCDYRNRASFATISSMMDFVGFTDGRFGAEGERTIYTMFYTSIHKDQNPNVSELVLDFSKTKDLGDVVNVLETVIDKFGGDDKLKVNYGKEGEFNTLHVLRNRVRTAGIAPTLVLANDNTADYSASHALDAQKKQQIGMIIAGLRNRREA